MWTGVLFIAAVLVSLFLGLIGLIIVVPLVGLIVAMLGELFGKWEE